MIAGMKRCTSGHHYDPTKHSSCPYCSVPAVAITATGAGKNQDDFVRLDEDATLPRGANLRGLQEGGESEEGITVGYFQKKIGIDPVVGWLVCTEGADRGRDYRLHSEKNFIGRSEHMDVCIRGDETISRENHAIVSFNPRNNTFKLQPGDGRGLVYLNGENIDTPWQLKSYDGIELGRTKFMFVPFCSDHFTWNKD